MTTGRAITTGWRAGARPAWRWAPWILLVIACLSLLVIAETVWLPDSMPREYASRSSVVLVPLTVQRARLDEGWSDEVVDRAGNAAIARAIITGLGLHDQSTGQSMEPERLVGNLRISWQCVRVPLGNETAAAGLRLSATVRGTDRREVDAVAAEWQAQVARVVGAVARPVVVDAASPLLLCGSP